MARFNLSYTHTFSSKMGYLVPVMTEEVLPGDAWRFRFSGLLRMLPLKRPVMHPVEISVFHFFCPTRLVDDSFEDFITGKLGKDAQRPVTTSTGDLGEHMGIPVSDVPVVKDPFRIYNFIWNEWFRDADLQQEVDLDDQNLLKAAWQKDYFTSARPVPQQGDSVSINIGGSTFMGTAAGSSGTEFFDKDGNSLGTNQHNDYRQLVAPLNTPSDNASGLNTAGSLDLNDLRRMWMQQTRAERRAQFGSRYQDWLRSIGVRPQDTRLDRPEMIAGATRRVTFSEVVSTASGGAGDVVADLYGHGIGMISHNPARRIIPEHGWIMSLLLVRPQTQYIDGIPRQFTRKVQDDYWHPESELLGPQPIKNSEVYADAASPDGTFGWVGRHDEYRYRTGMVSGAMRDEYLDWHLARDFQSEPALNSDFVTCDPSTRIFAESNSHDFVCYGENQIIARRLVSQEPMT